MWSVMEIEMYLFKFPDILTSYNLVSYLYQQTCLLFNFKQHIKESITAREEEDLGFALSHGGKRSSKSLGGECRVGRGRRTRFKRGGVSEILSTRMEGRQVYPRRHRGQISGTRTTVRTIPGDHNFSPDANFPFDISSVDTSIANTHSVDANATPPLVSRILEISKEYLSNAGPMQTIAGLLLSKLLTRPDMSPAYTSFIEWTHQVVSSATEDVIHHFRLLGAVESIAAIFKLLGVGSEVGEGMGRRERRDDVM
ncbi:hypothetical protein L1887_30478 [Cichorium endivia]|nr:hypothetical protein L1887_30478 [Cichorium endivia]